MSTPIDIFTPTGAVDAPQRNTDIYKVSYRDGQNGTYSSVIRFIPFYANPSKNIMQKYTSWVKDPVSNKGMYVDDPRAIGQPSPVVDMYFKLKNTKIATYEEFAKNYLSSKLNYASLVQIIKDPQHPELEGKIKVFVFGKTIWDKLHYEEFPQIAGQTGTNPFDPFKGRYFSIVCTNKSNFNNFDNSQFFDNKDGNGNVLPSGIWYLNPETGKMDVARDGMNRQHLVDYLAANSPDLNKYDFQAWNSEQTAHVNNVLATIENYITTGQLVNPSQGAMAGAMAALQTPTQGVMFPGATAQPGVSPTPVAPAGFTPGAPVPGAVPVTPQAPAPQAGFVPQPVVPQATPSVTPVAAPNVAPQAPAPQAASPAAGINMDDILNQL